MSDSSQTPPPSEVSDLAAACVRFVQGALDFTLDYSAETLPVLDHYLREQVRSAHAEATDLVASAAGAYFGEVVRRRIAGARWHCPAGDYASFRLEWEPFFLWLNPLGAAHEALAGTEVEGSNAHFQVLDEARSEVERSLAASGPVRGDDFYRLSVRLEALEQVADVLIGLEQKQPKPRHFGPEVYAAASGKPARGAAS